MIGFVPTAALSVSAFSGAAVAVSARPATTAKWTMVKSESVPFLDKQPNLPDGAPGNVGFDPVGLSNYIDMDWAQA